MFRSAVELAFGRNSVKTPSPEELSWQWGLLNQAPLAEGAQQIIHLFNSFPECLTEGTFSGGACQVIPEFTFDYTNPETEEKTQGKAFFYRPLSVITRNFVGFYLSTDKNDPESLRCLVIDAPYGMATDIKNPDRKFEDYTLLNSVIDVARGNLTVQNERHKQAKTALQAQNYRQSPLRAYYDPKKDLRPDEELARLYENEVRFSKGIAASLGIILSIYGGHILIEDVTSSSAPRPITRTRDSNQLSIPHVGTRAKEELTTQASSALATVKYDAKALEHTVFSF